MKIKDVKWVVIVLNLFIVRFSVECSEESKSSLKRYKRHPVISAFVEFAIQSLVNQIEKANFEPKENNDYESVFVKVHMYGNEEPRSNGCGFHVNIKAKNREGNGHLPSMKPVFCGGLKTEEKIKGIPSIKAGGKFKRYVHKMRITSPSATYSTKIHLGNDKATSIEIHSDGWHDTQVEDICFGFGERTAVSTTPFCINQDLLKSCNLNISDSDFILFTKTTKGIQKIGLNNIRRIQDFYKKDKKQIDFSELCDYITIAKGYDNSSKNTCPADEIVKQHCAGLCTLFKMNGEKSNNRKHIEIDPKKCERSEAQY